MTYLWSFQIVEARFGIQFFSVSNRHGLDSKNWRVRFVEKDAKTVFYILFSWILEIIKLNLLQGLQNWLDIFFCFFHNLKPEDFSQYNQKNA